MQPTPRLSNSMSSTIVVYVRGEVKNVIQFATISSTGNAQDFGDLTQNNQQVGFSDTDGGLETKYSYVRL